MNSVSNLIEGVAHEVNNSLSNIRLAGEILVEDLDEISTDEAIDAVFFKEKATSIIREVDRARSVIGELFQISRGEGFEKEPLSLRGILNRALAAQRGISDRIVLEVKVEDNLDICGDEHMLTTAFANVIADALSAIGDEGKLVIQASKKPDEMVEVSFTNSGKVPSEFDPARIFEPFFSTKKAGRGQGLGLFVPRRIVENHYGTIDAEISPCGGTTVRLAIPKGECRP